MQNPWPSLPHRRPFVLPEDEEAVAQFNRGAREEHRIRTEVLPEPFLGSREAPVVLLNLNAGFTEGNVASHERPDFIRASRAQLEHARREYPFHLLDPALSFDAGHVWWSKKLKSLIDTVSREAVASSVLCVEYFPYHSKRSGIRPEHRVDSQEYSFHLVRRAMERSAILVLLRAKRLWFGALPELARYADLHVLKSPQNVCISPRNCPTGYARIVEAVRSARRRKKAG